MFAVWGESLDLCVIRYIPTWNIVCDQTFVISNWCLTECLRKFVKTHRRDLTRR